jgi:hypothetical protein
MSVAIFAGSFMPIEPRAEEIARIKRELEILRSRYALVERWGRIMKWFLSICMPLAAIAVFTLIIVNRERVSATFGSGVVFWCSLVGFAAIIGAGLWIVIFPRSDEQSRWIDIVSPLPYFSFYQGSRSEAEQIEEQIAAREKRLMQLNGGPS